MTDIVERLRTSTEWAHCKHSMREEAAAEIERLQAHAKSMVDALNADIDAKAAEIERLRAALTGAETVMMIVEPRSHKAEYLAALAEARRALETKP